MQKIAGKLDCGHCYYEVPIWVETSPEGKVNMFWNQ